MQALKKNISIIILSLLYVLLCCYFIFEGQERYTLFSIGLIAIFFVVYYTKYAFLLLAFLTPLSINIEEYTDSFGLYVPTEPILFGLLLLLLFQQIKKNQLNPEIWKNPIIWAASFYLFWTFITSITSSDPTVSFKFLLTKIWFIVPLLFFGTVIFKSKKNIRTFITLFVIGMGIAIMYTLTIHASYNFGEKEGHWVMWPFFKDHTIYGSTVAFATPLVIGLLLSKKHNPIWRAILVFLVIITLLGLYYSYTRAAWLSVVAAVGVLALIKFKIKFSVVATITSISALIIFFSWNAIQLELARNSSEHTTTNFIEKIQSATNVTTDASNLERLNRWSCAISMFEEKPMFGFGPGTYAFEYARFQQPELLTIISTNFGNGGNAHSEYLGPLAEMGFFGLIAILFIVSALFYKGITLYIKWPKEDKEMRILLLSMILALVTYFVHGALNNYLDTDKAAVPIWTFAAAFVALEIVLNKKNKQSVTIE